MPTLHQKPEDLALNEREEIMQFIGRPPSVFMRFGITAVACVVALLLALSYFVKYPDIVVAKVVLTTENPPVRMLAKTGGRVSDILIKNNQAVKTGQLLAVMDNTAKWQDVLALDKNLQETVPLPLASGQVSIQLPLQLNVGVLQNNYSTLCQNVKEYRYFLERNGVLQKINDHTAQITSLKALNENLLNQKAIQAKEFELAEKDLNRQKLRGSSRTLNLKNSIPNIGNKNAKSKPVTPHLSTTICKYSSTMPKSTTSAKAKTTTKTPKNSPFWKTSAA
jgi:multidrug efflux pump subunit AcrA (membrane-fusion protein)